MLTDTHCHLASSQYGDDEIPALLQRAREVGVHRVISLATGVPDFEANRRLAEQHSELYFCAGIHPCDVANTPDGFAAQLEPLLSHPKLCAVGETGLDYYHPAPAGWEEEAYHQRQRDFLTEHFELAVRHDLNLALHTRDRAGEASLNDALALYERYAGQVRAVFHCFPGTLEQAQRIFALGGLISFTGNVTFKNAAQIRETAQHVPLDRFMVETDAPYLAPTPHRGTRNEPSYTREVAELIAQQKGISFAELSAATEATVSSFFRL